MLPRRLGGFRTCPGWLRFMAVMLGAVLVTVMIGPMLLLAGLGRDAGMHRDAPAAAPAPWSTADAAYVQAMLWHQEQALDMASLVQGRTARPELRRLARSMRAAQSSDIVRMRAWLRAHGAGDSSDDARQRPAEPAGRWFAGMMAAPQLQTLASATGQRFDFLFVDMLLEHHKGAIVMAEGVLADGSDAQVELFATSAITDSRRAIRQLTSWRRRWAEPFLRRLTSPTARSMPASP
jgi:uncharacterized protein (DUF305 family)